MNLLLIGAQCRFVKILVLRPFGVEPRFMSGESGQIGYSLQSLYTFFSWTPGADSPLFLPTALEGSKPVSRKTA